MKDKDLKFGSGKKKLYSMNLDIGVVEKVKDLYNGHLNIHVEQLLDQWCQDQEESKKFHDIVQETIEDLKKAGSTMPEEEAIKMLLQVSDERKKEIFNDKNTKSIIKQMEANAPTPSKEQKENFAKLKEQLKEKFERREKK